MKNKISLLLVSITFLLLTCEKEKPTPAAISNKITITTATATGIEYRSASIKGTLGDTYGRTVQDYGHCWDTAANPELTKNKTSFGNQKGAKTFTSQLQNLVPGKTYTVRAYFTIDDITMYSTGNSFITKSVGLPVVEIDSIFNISTVSASCAGEVVQANDDSVIARGICWNSNGSPTINNSKSTNGKGIGSFTSELTDLFVNTTYYVRAFATNSKGSDYGLEISFKTKGIPTLITNAVKNITATTAISGGNITEDWGFQVTDRGVCWSTSQNPTIDDDKTSDGSGAGLFSSTIGGFSSEITYYVRAYAINSIGTGYGNQESFTCNLFIDNRDNKEYKFVRIGNQVWMAENLAYLPEISYYGPYFVYDYKGSIVSEAKATINYATYGVLYPWPEAMNYASSSSDNPSGVQGVCPNGWHLPSDAEWQQLVDFISSDGHSDNEGAALKATSGWNSGGNGTDNYGFSALPGGVYDWYGYFYDVGEFGGWWSATDWDNLYKWYRSLSSNVQVVYHGDIDYRCALSVRCVRDN
jgi:uncharacterized protein (TIGR02145 family)